MLRTTILRITTGVITIAAAMPLGLCPRACAQVPDYKASPVEAELNEQNYRVWREHILPQQSELNWQKVPWLTTFKDGILAANAAQKPLLLWTMNGHPLGCT